MISIVIATYNRCHLIDRQIKSLLALSESKLCEYEVIYVDNNSTDRTFEKLNKLCRNISNFKVLYENQQGLSYARNRGTQEALGEYIWYMDDDSLPHKNSLCAYTKALSKWKPAIATGPIVAKSKYSLPAWLDIKSSKFDLYLARYNYGNVTKYLENIEAFGPNLVIKKYLINHVGGFNTDLGVKGLNRGGSEESEIQSRIKKSGGRLLYVHNAGVDHLIPREKLKITFYLKQNYQRALTGTKLKLKKGNQIDNTTLLLMKFITRILFALLFMSIKRTPIAISYLGICARYYGTWSAKRKYFSGRK